MANDRFKIIINRVEFSKLLILLFLILLVLFLVLLSAVTTLTFDIILVIHISVNLVLFVAIQCLIRCHGTVQDGSVIEALHKRIKTLHKKIVTLHKNIEQKEQKEAEAWAADIEDQSNESPGEARKDHMLDAQVKRQLHSSLKRGRSVKGLARQHSTRSVKVIPEKKHKKKQKQKQLQQKEKKHKKRIKTVDEQVERIRMILLMTIRTPSKLYSILRKLDVDDNRTLNKGEFLVLIKQIAQVSRTIGSDLSTIVLDKTWASVVEKSTVDTDGDGIISIKDEVNHSAVETWLFGFNIKSEHQDHMDKFRQHIVVTGKTKVSQIVRLQFQLSSLIHLAKAREEIETSKRNQMKAVEALHHAKLELADKIKDGAGVLHEDASLLDKFKYKAISSGSQRVSTRTSIFLKLQNDIALALAKKEIKKTKDANSAAMEALYEAQIEMFFLEAEMAESDGKKRHAEKLRQQAKLIGLRQVNERNLKRLKLQDNIAMAKAQHQRDELNAHMEKHSGDEGKVLIMTKLRAEANITGSRAAAEHRLREAELRSNFMRAALHEETAMKEELEALQAEQEKEKEKLHLEMEKLSKEKGQDAKEERERLLSKIKKLQEEGGNGGKLVAMAKFRAEARVAGIQSSVEHKTMEANLKQHIMMAALHEEHAQIEAMAAQVEAELKHTLKLEEQLNEQMEHERELAEEAQYLSEQLSQEASKRKKLHNQIEDMKGAIRVYCRIRPLSKTEIDRGNVDATEYLPDKCTIRLFSSSGGNINKKNKDSAKTFTFDSVFSPRVQQAPVFEDVKHLIQSAMDGYNVCIFAYGQTGSGKTWTMAGTTQQPGRKLCHTNIYI